MRPFEQHKRETVPRMGGLGFWKRISFSSCVLLWCNMLMWYHTCTMSVGIGSSMLPLKVGGWVCLRYNHGRMPRSYLQQSPPLVGGALLLAGLELGTMCCAQLTAPKVGPRTRVEFATLVCTRISLLSDCSNVNRARAFPATSCFAPHTPGYRNG